MAQKLIQPNQLDPSVVVQSELDTSAALKVDKDTVTFNAKDHGVVGDGVADDTAAIQAIINTIKSSTLKGGVLYFPAGTYKVSSSIDLSLDTTRVIIIRGASKTSTIFTTTANITVFLHAEECVFQDFTVSQLGTAKTGRAFSTPTTRQAAYTVYERIRVRDFKYGIWWRYSLWCSLRNVRMTNCAVGIKMSRNALPDDSTNPAAPGAWNVDPGFFHNQNTFDNVLADGGEIGIWGTANGNVFSNVTCQNQSGDGASNVAAPAGMPGTGMFLQGSGSGTSTFGAQSNNIVNYYTEVTRQPIVLEYTKTTIESIYVQGAVSSGTAYPQVIKITGGSINARTSTATGTDWFSYVIVATDATIYGDPAAGTTTISTLLAGAHLLTNTLWYRSGIDAGDNQTYVITGAVSQLIATMSDNTLFDVSVMELYDGATLHSAKFSVARWNTTLTRIISDAGNSSQITLSASTSALTLAITGSLQHNITVSVVAVRKLGQFPYRS